MSTDLEIRSDDSRSKHTTQRELYTFLRAMPYVTMSEDRYGEYEVPDQGLFMQIYLVVFNEAGEEIDIDNIPDSLRSRVDALVLHIPAGFAPDVDGLQPYLKVGRRIAEHLKWRIFDSDLGTYLD